MSKRKFRARFRPKFENGGFWEYYSDLERQFTDFLEYVPYLDKQKQVCSFRLVNLLLSIGGHIDSAFKEMAGYRGFSRDKECKEIRRKVWETRKRIRRNQSPITIGIQELLSPFEKEYKLSQRKVTFKRLPKREDIIPFYPHNQITNAPEWWEIYNGLKHDFTDNFEKADLQITRNALAGAFLLNAIHKPSIIRLYDFGVLKPTIPFSSAPARYTLSTLTRPILLDIVEKGQSFSAIVETFIFKFDYNQWGGVES